MDQNFQTSFIPKKPVIKEEVVAKRPVGFLLVASIALFFIVLLGTAGLYFYKKFAANQIITVQKNLTLAKNRFEPSKIAELQLLDKRLDAASEILTKHISIVPIFKALEQITMRSVRYNKFSYSFGPDNNSNINIKMSGVAVGYRSIALQSDLFTKNKNLIDPVFSNLTLDVSGNVLFDLDFSVTPAFVNYKQAMLLSTN